MKIIEFLKSLFDLNNIPDDNVLMYITANEALPTPLTAEEEAEVMARLRNGEQSAKGTLIERNLRLVVYIARKFDNTGIDVEDLISVGKRAFNERHFGHRARPCQQEYRKFG